ncbi:spore germination protein GerPC [Fredinandcohnia sp. 179-A 10B2 NHS]|uniref:spore germination protein GerPC n=1 Tax=Fredinandcohnia sp. 179-A 10B2 NHS TaxID=3235176 RepID=UPI0039A1DF5C
MYPNYCDISLYIHKLNQYIEQQNQRIGQLEQLVQSIRSEMEDLKRKPATRIDKIEYKFDQLKVETLEGTLNIGLNPMNNEQIEDFDVPQSKVNIPDIRHTHKDLIDEIQNDIEDYLSNDCPTYINTISSQKRTSLEEGHTEFIIEDIRKQIHERILYYVEQNNHHLQNPSNENHIYETILSSLKTDIQNSITAYINHLPLNKKEGNNS